MAKPAPRVHNVLITGANEGIGFLLAKAYAKRGHRVLATGRKFIQNDQEHFGFENVTYIRADQEDAQDCAHAISNAMREMGWTQLDLAILNAATGWTGEPQFERARSIRHQIAVNLTAPITISKALAPWLFVDNGILALIGSTAIRKPRPNFATYIATKAGLDGFARSLREEWRGRASVLMIHPGPTRTQMHQKAGLKLGLSRMFFMSAKRSARSIQKAIRKKEKRPFITRTYGWFALFSFGKAGRL